MRGHDSTERADAPVLGNLLLAAVVIVLVGTAGLVVFGVELPTDRTVPPQASFSTTYADGELTIRHEGGDPLRRGTLTYVSAEHGELAGPRVEENFPTRVTSSDTLVLAVGADDTVRIVWASPRPRSDDTEVVFVWSGGSQGR